MAVAAITQTEPFRTVAGSDFTPCGATVMIAVRTEKLFQIIIGPGQIRHRIAGKESWPVTTGDLPEVPQRRCKRASRSLCRVIAPRSPPRRRCTVNASCCSWLLRMWAA